MGVLTLIRAVCADLPANTEGLESPLPEALLTFSFAEREAAQEFQPSAAINNSIETEWVHAVLESFSTDCLPAFGGRILSSSAPFWGTCHLKCYIKYNRTKNIGESFVLP